MAVNFPSSLDTSTTLPQPAGTSLLTSPDHAGGHTSLSQAVIALETKLGAGAGTPTATNKLLVGSGNGTAVWGGTVNSLVLGTPTITAGVISTSTIGTSTITGGTVNSAVLGTPDITGGTVTSTVLNNNTMGSPAITGGTQTATLSVTRTIGSAVYSGTVSGTSTLNLALATRHLVNMPNSAGAVTLAVSNAVANQPFIIEVLQGTAGNGTITFFSTLNWITSGGTAPAQGTTPSKKNTYGFITTGAATFDAYVVGRQG